MHVDSDSQKNKIDVDSDIFKRVAPFFKSFHG